MNAHITETILPSDRQPSFASPATQEPRRPRIGLALSSGGARGLSHVGVIQVLEENGITIDAVAGCSMGSYIGALWAHGETGAQMESLACELESRGKLLRLIDPALPPRRGFLYGNSIIRNLKRTIGEAHFADLARPLRVVATNLDTLECTVFSDGPVAMAVHASCAIPGVCVPVTIGDETFIDGGVTDPLPVDALHAMGMDKVIAVNTIPTTGYLKCCREWEREIAAHAAKKSRAVGFINTQLNYFARGNVLDTMMRAVHGAQIRVAESASRRADVVLRPLACDARWHDFIHPQKYIALGRRVAEENLPAIKSLIASTEVRHENVQPQIELPAAA